MVNNPLQVDLCLQLEICLRHELFHVNQTIPTTCSVFQLTFKGRVSTRTFERSIDVGLPTDFLKFTIYFVGSGGQIFRVFDLRPLSYLERCLLAIVVYDVKNVIGF